MRNKKGKSVGRIICYLLMASVGWGSQFARSEALSDRFKNSVVETAQSICDGPSLSLNSTQQVAKANASVKADIKGLASKLVNLGVGGSVEALETKFSGLTREQIAAELKDRRDCKKYVFTELLAAFSHSQAEENAKINHSPDETLNTNQEFRVKFAKPLVAEVSEIEGWQMDQTTYSLTLGNQTVFTDRSILDETRDISALAKSGTYEFAVSIKYYIKVNGVSNLMEIKQASCRSETPIESDGELSVLILLTPQGIDNCGAIFRK